MSGKGIISDIDVEYLVKDHIYTNCTYLMSPDGRCNCTELVTELFLLDIITSIW